MTVGGTLAVSFWVVCSVSCVFFSIEADDECGRLICSVGITFLVPFDSRVGHFFAM